jgi:hypothetical protein
MIIALTQVSNFSPALKSQQAAGESFGFSVSGICLMIKPHRHIGPP